MNQMRSLTITVPSQRGIQMHSSSISIRRATPADAPIVLTLLKELARHQGSPAAVKSRAEQWQEYLQREDIFVLLAEFDGQATGYVSAVRRTHLWSGRDILGLDDLYVRSGWRNAGVGMHLMRAMARFAEQDGLLIRWEVRVENGAAQRFYSRLGASLNQKVIASWAPEQYMIEAARR
jgi:ribosomal protein S18 acetylase RimI-like enzyme